jgi:thiol-disulfide isomerase/thioredoxin
MMPTAQPTHSALAPLDRAPTWLNSPPLTAHALLGHVVAVDFWTYTCINWLRTLPYLRAWSERYGARGLVVIGVHAPEFSFEHELGNVRRAVSELGVPYPVVIDNDFATWRAFANHYWPALYLVDGAGHVRYDHFGEGAYDAIERQIQQQLGIDEELSRVDAGGLAEAADWGAIASPETYLGAGRGDQPLDDLDADRVELNDWALGGGWTQEDEAAVAEAAGASLAYRFRARDVNLVLSPSATGDRVGFQVRLDGQPPGAAHGLDIDEAGTGTVAEPRMYQLIRQPATITERTVEIAFDTAGVRAFVFTFG